MSKTKEHETMEETSKLDNIEELESDCFVEGEDEVSTLAMKKRKQSDVWNHFDRLSRAEYKEPHSKCKYCGAVYACHSKRNGTTSMNAHMKVCKKYPYARPKDPSQKKLVFGVDKNMTSIGIVCESFSIENARRLIAEMIIIDELPFSHVENRGFRRLMEGTIGLLEPRFKCPSRPTVTKDVLEIYRTEKHNLKQIFVSQGYRVSLTTDTWTSIQNINYMVLTAHFIDNNWNLHKRIINFCQIENHKGETIGKEVERCLRQWGIEKVLTLTVDNASSNDTAIAYLVRRFKSGLVLDGEFLHVRCCAHILNLIVSDGLKDVCESVSRIRNVVRYVRSSPARFSRFKQCIVEENIACKSIVCLDVQTRWNSTYLMLEAAEKYERSFERLEDYDNVYLKEDTPNCRDWEVARIFIKFLAVFYEVTLRISGSKYVTSNMVFREISTIHNCIKNYSQMDDENGLLKDIASKMEAKYNKYWGNCQKLNYLLYVSVILDPCYKMKYLSYCLVKLYGEKVAKEICAKVECLLRRLFNEYTLSNIIDASTSNVSKSKPLMDESTSSKGSCIAKSFCFDNNLDDMDEDGPENELDVYLLETRTKRDDSFDILVWWKNNAPRYPILCKIARDILAIPVSTVASESAFSTGGRVVDPFRSSLAPATVEALVCAQNWLNGDNIEVDIRDHLDEVVRIEEEFKACMDELGSLTLGDNATQS